MDTAAFGVVQFFTTVERRRHRSHLFVKQLALIFDPQPTLQGGSLALRPLEPDDLLGLHEAASDAGTWIGHPVKDRYKREVFEPYFRFLLESGTTLAVLDRLTSRIIGCSRYYVAPDQTNDIAIGFTFLDKAYWGGKTNAELKGLMLDHAYKSFKTVWFHIDPANVRSQKATLKLGAKHFYDAELDLSGKPARWMCFRLDTADWTSRNGPAGD